MKKYTITVIDNETGKPAEVNGKTIQADTDVLAGFLAYVTEIIEKRLSPKGGAALLMHMAEELARRACMETEAKA